MRKYFLFLSVILVSFSIPDVIDRIGVAGPLEFNKTKFLLSWTDTPKDNYLIQEYVPEGEKVESFNQMLTVHLFLTDMQAQEGVQQKVRELELRKKTDATCQYQVNKSPDGKEFVIDFILGESKGDKMTIMEFNIYRYKSIDLGKKKALLIYSYSKRAYGDGITPFLQTLGDERHKLLMQMISAEMPNVKLIED